VRNVKNVVGKLEGKRPHGNSRRSGWEDDILLHGNEPSGTIKDEEILDQLSDYQQLKMGSAPWSQMPVVLRHSKCTFSKQCHCYTSTITLLR
jgi:hypothetical protein